MPAWLQVSTVCITIMKGWFLSACIITGLGGCAGLAPSVGPENENHDLDARIQDEPEAHKSSEQDLSEDTALRMQRAQQALNLRPPQSAREQGIGDAAGEMFFEHLVQCSLLFARLSMLMTHLHREQHDSPSNRVSPLHSYGTDHKNLSCRCGIQGRK